MNAILRDEIQVLCEWNMIDWVLIKDDNGKLMIESITIEKEDEIKNLVCDALFNFYEKTINLNSFLGNFHYSHFETAFNRYRDFSCEVYGFSIFSCRSRFRRFISHKSRVSHQRSVYFRRWYHDEIFQKVLLRIMATPVL